MRHRTVNTVLRKQLSYYNDKPSGKKAGCLAKNLSRKYPRANTPIRQQIGLGLS